MISFLSVFPPYRGGIAKFSDALFTELHLQTEIKPYSFKKLYPELLFPGTSQTLEGDFKPYARPVFHPYNPLNWKRSANRIASSRPEVLLYSYWHPFFAPGFLRMIRSLKKTHPPIKTVSITHNVLPHEYFPFKKQLSRRLLERTDLNILLSSQTEEDYARLNIRSDYRKLFHPVYELPTPSADRAELRQERGFDQKDKIVLFMGLVRDYKGVDLLIEAMNELNSTGDTATGSYKTMIVGEFYTAREPLLAKIDPVNRNQFTVIDEFISEQRMSDILHLADLLVLPYRRGTQSGILANAIHAGLPALISDLPGLSEHITPGKNGLIFRTGDAQDLKNQIQHYFQKDMKATLSENLDRLRQSLSWKKFAADLLTGINSL